MQTLHAQVGHHRRVEIVLIMLLAAATMARAGDGVIHNDVAWRDTAGNEIWCNGGHIIREGELFYWVGYDTGPGRWPWKINLYSSPNLADWKLENTVIRMQGKFADMGWAGRPALLHCEATGKYIIVFEADSARQWKRHKAGFAVCDRIDGTYELAAAEYPEPGRSTGDQSVYQEGDHAYLLATMDKDIGGRKYMNQSLAIFELSKDFLHVERNVFEGFDNVSGHRNVVPREHSSREASHIIKVGDVYYWFSSALVGWNSSATMYATAKDLAGPWSELKMLRTDPASNDSYDTQHDFIVPVVGREATTWVYVGDRYSQWTKRGTGRNVFLPLVWENEQPLLRWHKDWEIDVSRGMFTAIP
ncbi:MAG: family 43 glycosylhydrolase [Planctomycetota bacterium]|nr:family 43 glycosylhydrolase [Planctomycetota bacterium]